MYLGRVSDGGPAPVVCWVRSNLLQEPGVAMTGPDVEVLREVGPCLVVDKPGGVLTQAPPGVDSMECRVRRWLSRRQSSEPYLGVPHRIDRPVSGTLVFTTRAKATRQVGEQFADRVVGKTYFALVEGVMEDRFGRWVDFVRKVPDEPRAEMVNEQCSGAKQAILCFQLHQVVDDISLVEVGLETGRMHQIRLQFASRGHAVLGDSLYGSSRSFGPQTTDVRERWIALHARKICFRHPQTREPVVVAAPIPACWKESPGWNWNELEG